MATKIELEHALLMAEHDYKHADNNARAFRFRASLAKTEDAKRDNEGSAFYYDNQKRIISATLYDLRCRINGYETWFDSK